MHDAMGRVQGAHPVLSAEEKPTGDWRTGKLLGSGYALVIGGEFIFSAATTESIRKAWMGIPELAAIVLPDSFIKEVYYVLPPWKSLHG